MTSGRIQQVGFEDKPLRLHTGYMGVGRLLSVNNWTGGMGDCNLDDPETCLPSWSDVAAIPVGGTNAGSGSTTVGSPFNVVTTPNTSNTTVAIVLAVCAGLVLLLAGKR